MEPVLGVERGWVGGHRLGKHSEHSLGELAFSLSTQGEGQPSHPCPTRLCGPGSCQGRPAAVAEQEPPSALQDLEPQQLLLFVQSFGIPVSSMSKLLQYLDQAVAHDPQTLEQNIMDKSEPWGPRRALGGGGAAGPGCSPIPCGRTSGLGFLGEGCPLAGGHAHPRPLLCRLHGSLGGGSARAWGVRRPDLPLPAHSLPARPERYPPPGPRPPLGSCRPLRLGAPRRGPSVPSWVVGPQARPVLVGVFSAKLLKAFSRHHCSLPADSTEVPKPKSSPEPPPGQGRTRAVTQVRALGPEDDLAGMLLQVVDVPPPSSPSARPGGFTLEPTAWFSGHAGAHPFVVALAAEHPCSVFAPSHLRARGILTRAQMHTLSQAAARSSRS